MSFSIIVPVLNEEGTINAVIGRLKGLAGTSGAQIIVADGGQDWRTLDAITCDGIIKVRSPRGRGRQMNEAAGYATGDILLFLHVDTQLPVNGLSLIENAMRDGSCVGGAFDLAIASPHPLFRMIERTASLRSRITRIPFGDQAIFMRKTCFDSIGGYRDIPIMEDVEIMKRVKKRGDSIVILRSKAVTSSRRWDNEGIIRCTVRNWLLQLLYPLGVPEHILARLYK